MNPIALSCESYGEGPDLLLLHGFTGSSAYWRDLVPLLSNSYRVWVPDLRGHGRSPVPEGPYAIEQFADDLAALLDRIGLSSIVLLGHSLGGYVALSFAERYADRLRGFGLVHSTPLPDDENGKANRLKAIETIEQQGIRPFVDGLIPKLFAPTQIDKHADQVQYAKQIGYDTEAAGAVGTIHAMRERPDRSSVIIGTELPVLLLAGEEDQVVTPAKAFAARNSNTTETLLPGVGHMGMLERPEATAEAIRAYLAKVHA